jgi:hypothetical protein
METIVAQLNEAISKHQLINIYLNTGDIFYTGYVVRFNQTEVLVSTYESSGMADGYVVIKIDLIESIEFNSEDLSRIKEKMAIVHNDGLMEAKPMPIDFDSDIHLFPQVLIQAYLSHSIVLLQDTSSQEFYTGIIKVIKNDTFDFLRLDKFNFMNNQVDTLTFDSIQIIEFQGRELNVMSQVVNQLPVHQTPRTAESINNIFDLLNYSFHHSCFIEVRSRYNDHFFYVGKVIMLNDQGVILKVVDMAGQFGGYVFMKINGIERVSIDNDYLNLITLMEHDNQNQNCLSQPVLNDMREFDSTEDNFLGLLNQSMQQRKLIRLQLKNGSSFLGYPAKIGPELIKFSLLDETGTFFIYGREVALNDIVEIGFEYIYAYLDERRLKLNGDM